MKCAIKMILFKISSGIVFDGFFFFGGGGGYIIFWDLMFDLTLRYRSNQNTVVLQILRQRKAHLRFRSVTRVNDIHACCWYPMVR